MTTIASLVVSLGLDTAEFATGAKKAEGKVQSFTDRIKNIRSAAGGLALNALKDGIINGSRAFLDMVKSTAEEIDALDELAQQSGLTGTQLGKLQYAAIQTGAKAEGVGDAIAKMNATIGKAASTGKDDAFNDIGVSLDKILELDSHSAFLEIADAISKLENSYEQANAAQKIFGKGGKDLLNLIRTGRGAIGSLGSDAESTGFAPTAEMLEKIGRADEAYNKLHGTLKGLRNIVSAEVAPAFEALNNLLADALNKKDVLDKLTRVSAPVSEAFSPLPTNAGESIAGAARAAAFQAAAIEKAAAAQVDISMKARQEAFERQKTLQALSAQREEITRVAAVNKEIVDDINKQIAGMQTLEQKVAEAFKAGGDPKQLREMRLALEGLNFNNRVQAQQQEMRQRRDAILQELQTAQEIHRLRLADIEAIRKAGGLNDFQAQLAKAAANKQLVDSLKQQAEERKANDPLRELKDRAASRDLLTPLQKWNRTMTQLQQEAAAGLLSADQKLLGRLQADREFFQAQDRPQEDTGPRRPAALERGTAEAFSASFGAVAKPVDKLLQVARDEKIVLERIDAKLGGRFPIGN